MSTCTPGQASRISGVYPPTVQAFPIGEAMSKNVSIQGGNCNHRRYIPSSPAWWAGAWSSPTRC